MLTTSNYSYSVELNWGKLDDVDCYVASAQYIVAKELGKTLYFTPVITMKNGDTIRGAFSGYSPEEYARNKLNNAATDTELKDLVKAMVVYGEKAKIYFS